MNIPDEAIEAAAKKHDPWLWNYLDSLGPATEDSMAHHSRVNLLERAKGVIEAAAPFIAAHALRDAAEEFEASVGVTEFEEQSVRDGARWAHAHEDWEHQGPYMDWLRNRADQLEGEQ